MPDTGYMQLVDPEIARVADALESIAQSAGLNVTTTAEAYAIGTRNGVPVQSGDPTFHNNSKWYAEAAAAIVAAIEHDAQDAEAAALVVEGYTAGKQNGVPVGSDSPYYQNNMAYFMQQAKGSEDAAALSAAAALAAAQTASAAYGTDLFADVYNALSNYAVGEYAIYNGGLYRCIVPITGGEAWDSTHWESAQACDALKELMDGVSGIRNMIAPAHDSASVYQAGDVVIHRNGLYRRKTDSMAAEPWTPENWDAIRVGDLLGGLSFDGGYCAVNERDGKVYLHLTLDGQDIDGFSPIQLPDSGMAFDGGFAAEDPEDGKWYLHLTLNDVELSADDYTPIELPAGGGGGGGSTIVLSNVVKVSAIRNGADAIFSFTATSSDASDTITAQWYVDGAAAGAPVERDSGEQFEFNAKGLLRESGTSVVRVTLTSEAGGSLTRQWTVASTEFSIRWGNSVTPIMLFTENENISVQVIVGARSGSTNTVTLAVGNNQVDRVVTGSRTLTVELDRSWFVSGANTVTANMVSGADPSETADEISFTVLWGYGASGPMVAFASDSQTGMQYDLIEIPFYAYDPSSETATCVIQVESETPRSMTVGREIQVFQYTYAEVMAASVTKLVTLSCGTAGATMSLTIAKNPYNLNKITGDALRYELDPAGHSNTDADRWDFAGIGASGFMRSDSGVLTTGEFDWSNGGFQPDEEGGIAFVVKKGYRVELPRSLFADSDTNGKTIDIAFRVANSDQYDAIAMQDMNNGQTKGLILRSNEGEIRLASANGQVFRYCENSRIEFSVRVEGNVSQRLSTVWLDGIPSKADKYEDEMLMQNENHMLIGSDHCDVWVYAIRVYNAALDDDDMLQNYIATGATMAVKTNRFIQNDVYDKDTGELTIASLHAAVPDLTIIEIAAARMTVSKSDPVPADVRIIDKNATLNLGRLEGTVFKVQGTSSAAYGRSCYNMDVDFSGTAKTYSISDGAIPVNYLNIKVNVASSENANNICAVDWYNTYQPFLKPRRANPGVRDTVEGKPCAVFFTNTGSTAQWISSQYVQPGETILYAMGDLCNSKKNKAVFGQDSVGEHCTLGCVEVSGNDTQAQKFLATAVYNAEDEEWQNTVIREGKLVKVKEFEWRMKPKSANLDMVVAAWNALVSWVISTNGNPAKFRAEAAGYFTMKSMLYHFLMIEYFAGYDNVSKNTFYSYDWDDDVQDYRWNIVEAYDWDTILAADNDGKPYGDYGLDYGDTIGTSSYFNAVENPIWNNIQAAYQDELSALYVSLRSAGAWDSVSIIVKWDDYQACRPHALMIRDAWNKYILPYKTTGVIIDGKAGDYDESYLPRLQGSKTYWRRQFLTYQTDYMDGKYGYYSKTNSMQFRTNGASGTKTFVVKAYAKTYITVIVDDNKVASQKVDAGDVTSFTGVSVGSNTTLYFTPDRLIQYIRPLNETFNSTFVASGAAKLMEAMLGGETANPSWPAGTSLNIPSAILKNLSLRNMTYFASALNLASNVELETLDTRGTNAGRITLAPYAPLTSILLNACTGIVARNLSKAEEFSLASGTNLTYIRVENCNTLINNAILTYLFQLKNAGGTATKNLRIMGVNWTLADTGLLNWLLGLGSISESGATGEAPCVLSGRVYVPEVRSGEFARYQAAWPGVVTYGNFVQQYAVSFFNDDGVTPVLGTDGKSYVQYVDAGQSAHDPIQAGEAIAPTKPADNRYVYTFDGWDSLPVGVIDNQSVRAVYQQAEVSYTVQYYNGIGAGDGTKLEEHTNLVYGDSDAPTDPYPRYTAMEGSNVYYVFSGWDKSVAFIRPDPDADPLEPYTIKVHARWIIGNLVSQANNPGLGAMNWAQRYAVAKNNLASSYWEPRETMEITMGHGEDYLFDNVESRLLVSEPVYLDGTAPIIFNGKNSLPLIQLFNGSIDRFTLAIDYETTGDSGVLVSCFNDNGNQGFQLRRTGNYNNVLWGDQNVNVGYKYQRGMLVIRYNRGMYPLVLYMTHDGNLIANEYPLNTDVNGSHVTLDARARSVATETEAPLTFGGVGFMDGTDITSVRATGWIHWARIWYDDLGADCSKSMAAMPHVKTRFAYNEIRYRDGLDYANTVSADFFDEGCMPLLCRINWTSTNAGGWQASMMRAFLNGQYFAGLPIPLQMLIVEARVRATAGGGSSASPSREVISNMDKVYLSAYAELFAGVTGNNADNAAYVDELDDNQHRIPGFVYDSTKGQTTDNQTRIRWPGYTLPNDANYIVGTSDPTTPGLGYTIHSGKTVWIKTDYSSNGYLYIDGDTAAKHGWYAGRNLSDTNTNNIKAAAGPDSDGGTNGIWILASYWWSRSPYVTNSTHFWGVYTYGGSNTTGAYGAFGAAARFSI